MSNDYYYYCTKGHPKRNTHLGASRYDCYYCSQEKFWKKRHLDYNVCIKHNIPYRITCVECTNETKPDWILTSGIYDRQKKYREALNEFDKHVNEKCSSCDKPINFDEWFCYCALCPDCYLNSDEEIDNYLGEKKDD